MLAAKSHEPSKNNSEASDNTSKQVRDTSAQPPELNPIWHHLATHVGGYTANSASNELSPIQAKYFGGPRIQRQTIEEEEELTSATQPNTSVQKQPEEEPIESSNTEPVGIQTKLTVGSPNDKYEQEADRVADMVMCMPEPAIQPKPTCSFARGPSCGDEEASIQTTPLSYQITPVVQRRINAELEEEEEKETEETIQGKLADGIQVQRQEDEPPEGPTEGLAEKEEEIDSVPTEDVSEMKPIAPEEDRVKEDENALFQAKQVGATPRLVPNLEAQIRYLKGGGRPLSHAERSFFEPRFGYEFSQVRVHTDKQAADAAQVLKARAFTRGSDIVFRFSQYEPGTEYGKKLLAHELAHVVQQSGTTKIIKGDLGGGKTISANFGVSSTSAYGTLIRRANDTLAESKLSTGFGQPTRANLASTSQTIQREIVPVYQTTGLTVQRSFLGNLLNKLGKSLEEVRNLTKTKTGQVRSKANTEGNRVQNRSKSYTSEVQGQAEARAKDIEDKANISATNIEYDARAAAMRLREEVGVGETKFQELLNVFQGKINLAAEVSRSQMHLTVEDLNRRARTFLKGIMQLACMKLGGVFLRHIAPLIAKFFDYAPRALMRLHNRIKLLWNGLQQGWRGLQQVGHTIVHKLENVVQRSLTWISGKENQLTIWLEEKTGVDVGDLVHRVGSFFIGLKEKTFLALNGLKSTTLTAESRIKGVARSILSTLIGKAQPIIDGFKGAAATIAKGFKQRTGLDIMDFLKKGYSSVQDLKHRGSSVLRDLRARTNSIKTTVGEKLNLVLNRVRNLPKKAQDAITTVKSTSNKLLKDFDRIDWQSIFSREGIKADWRSLIVIWFCETSPPGMGKWVTKNGVPTLVMNSQTAPDYIADMRSRHGQTIIDQFRNAYPDINSIRVGGDPLNPRGFPFRFTPKGSAGEKGPRYTELEWFTGTFDVKYEVLSVDKKNNRVGVRVIAFNESTWYSATRLPEGWQKMGLPRALIPWKPMREGFGPGGRFDQEYIWEETIHYP